MGSGVDTKVFVDKFCPSNFSSKYFDVFSYFLTLQNLKPLSVWISSFLPERYAGLMHLGLLFLGIILMDAGVNLLYTPFEALLDDMYGHNAVQRAFGIKSLMVSLGGCLGNFIQNNLFGHAACAEKTIL